MNPAAAPASKASKNGDATSLTLLSKLRSNEPAAWSRLDRLYGPLVAYWCNRSGVCASDIDDVRQDVWRTVFQRLESFRRDRHGDSFRGWLRGISRNIVLAHFRQVRQQPRGEGGTDAAMRLQETPEILPEADADPEPEVAALYHRARDLIRAEFPAHYWRAFDLTALQGMPGLDAAAHLGLAPALIRQAKARILKRLKEELGDA